MTGLKTKKKNGKVTVYSGVSIRNRPDGSAGWTQPAGHMLKITAHWSVNYLWMLKS